MIDQLAFELEGRVVRAEMNAHAGILSGLGERMVTGTPRAIGASRLSAARTWVGRDRLDQIYTREFRK